MHPAYRRKTPRSRPPSAFIVKRCATVTTENGNEGRRRRRSSSGSVVSIPRDIDALARPVIRRWRRRTHIWYI